MTYKEKKAAARERVMAMLEALESRPATWGEIVEVTAYFEDIARRYGLTRELRENGII